MEKSSQQHIKWENTRTIFETIANAGSISRAEVATKTGLSLMTVGKVADNLVERSILAQAKDERILAGRKARLLTCHPAWHILILDLTVTNFRLMILDLSLKMIDDVVYRCDEGLFCEENLMLFLKNLPIYQLTPTDPDHCIGAGVLLPGAYDETTDRVLGALLPTLNPLHPRKLLTGLLPAPRLLLIENIRAAAHAATSRMEKSDGQCLLWLSLGRPVSGAVVVDGKPMLGAHNCAGRFGEITVGTNFTLNQAMYALTDPTEQAAAVAAALFSLITALDPVSVLLESGVLPLNEPFLNALNARLAQMNAERALPLPSITISDSLLGQAPRGAALILREEWLRGMIE